MPCTYSLMQEDRKPEPKFGKQDECQFSRYLEGVQGLGETALCAFHRSLSIDDRPRPGEKSGWNQTELQLVHQTLLEAARRMAAKKGHVDLSGIQLQGPLPFRELAALNVPVSFAYAKFGGIVDISDLKFNSVLSFREAIFHGGLRARSTWFQEVRFAGARFCDAPGGKESAQLDFTDAAFANEVTFASTEYPKNSCFQRAQFLGGVRFNQGRFLGRVVFTDTKIQGAAASFRRVHFDGCASFTGTTFDAPAFFEESNFEAGLLCNDTRFRRPVSFHRACFGARSSFVRSVFCDVADFSGGRTPNGKPEPEFRKISFEHAVFMSHVSFVNRTFAAPTSFKGTDFHVAPRFHGSELHEDINFSLAQFRDTKSEGAYRAYRKLKLSMEELRARDDEARFFALEQKSLRNNKDTPKMVRFFSVLYELSSDFGRSLTRPTICFVIVMSLFFLIYICLAAMLAPIEFSQALRVSGGDFFAGVWAFSLEQAFRPFGVWAGDYKSRSIELAVVMAGNGALLRTIASIQSIFCLAMAALFVLALRRRFKMD